MERLYARHRNTNRDMFSAPSHRISQHPVAVKSGEGLGFEDMGSSFGPPKSVVTYGKTFKSKFMPATALPARRRKAPSHITDDESDDELLLSSQNTTGGSATSSPKRIVKGKKQENLSDVEETVCVNGRVLAAHPNYKPSSFNAALKGLRFTKTKTTSVSEAVAEVPPPSSSLTNSQDLFKPISDDIQVLDRPPSDGSSSSRQKSSDASSTRRKSSSATRAAARRFIDPNDSSKPPSRAPEDTPRLPTKPRPQPRIVMKSVPQRDSSPECTPRPAAQKRSLPLHSRTPELPLSVDSKRAVKKPPPSRRERQEFPMSLQAKENSSDGVCSGDACSTKTRRAAISRAATFVHTSKSNIFPSPLKTKSVSRGTTFPHLSPLSSPMAKGKTWAKSPDEGDGDLTGHPGKRGGLKPFPMSSQMLAGIDRRSKSPSTHSLTSMKRTSSDDSGAEQKYTAKRRKDSCLGVSDTFDYLHEPMEDDSIELGYARDPSKMCPYCDEELPSHPTPFLQQLLTTARKKSISDPRPRNRCGLKAPLTIYISVCQRHRFESHQLPIATKRGWPKTINFTKVPMRVKNMKRDLEAIIFDKDDISDIEDPTADEVPRGPKCKSVFWREVKREMKKRGSRTVVGVKGQFASFEKTQPGYYGEQGSIIIHQTLFDLFPPSTFDASLIAPLAPAEFIQHILVPEVAVRLIAQDLCVDIEEAVVTLRESAQYGVAMFPDTGENKSKGASADDEMGIADQIVMERARARRKELAEEERAEKEILKEERATQRAKARKRRREKALQRAQKVRETKAVTGNSESDAMSVDSVTSTRSARAAKNGTRGDRGNMGRAIPQLDGSDSDIADFVGDSKHKASVGGRTRERNADPNTRVSAVTTASHERKEPFSGFASLNGHRGYESTPRPWTTDATTTETTAGGSDERILPLQIARNRPSATDPSAHGGWSQGPRTAVPNDSDSDMSNSSRRSQSLVRRPMSKGGPTSWLFTSSSSDSPRTKRI